MKCDKCNTEFEDGKSLRRHMQQETDCWKIKNLKPYHLLYKCASCSILEYTLGITREKNGLKDCWARKINETCVHAFQR